MTYTKLIEKLTRSITKIQITVNINKNIANFRSSAKNLQIKINE